MERDYFKVLTHTIDRTSPQLLMKSESGFEIMISNSCNYIKAYSVQTLESLKFRNVLTEHF